MNTITVLPRTLARVRISLQLPRIGETLPRSRCFSTTCRAFQQSQNKYDVEARKLSQKSLDEHEQEVKVRQHQVQRPWHRQDADKPPVDDDGNTSDEPLTKGKLLTTPTRLLKLILPLPIAVEKDKSNNSNTDYGRSISSNDTIQPLALLVHPQQPLSYVERLIQAELPPVLEDGKEKIPNVYFRAEDTEDHSSKSGKKSGDDGGRKNVASYSGLGHKGPERSDKKWVRWSSSTEMGDFIRDAARGREFAIEVEGYDFEMRVGVPSFGDRTYYMRARLRKMSSEIDALAKLKKECDLLAHRGAHRIAKAGFAALSGWWGVVYYITFHTEYGWDLVEPVTYLAGLSTIMGGYLWFLYINKDLSYRAAMNVTVSKRQHALYEARGLNMERWDQLVQEANALRREVRAIAVEYDVDWDEAKDVGEDVKEVLDEEKSKSGEKSAEKEKEMDEDLTRKDNRKRDDDKDSKKDGKD
ncbi:hypothetical protein QBC37DRAFT_140646 [Rhypophila decipiens]|uniref:Calcium uniporter protein n=1 Tax=Rhypophila decipiens TaxID=261697 RepID=A0AAN7BBJ2_9PEZI|nr:hypothetical protein QBC37DRAFT_140646 [Rhypophila decipiens]